MGGHNNFAMKKILEVLQYGDFDIRFNTDIKALKNPNVIPDVTSRIAISMSTSLWGGNERDVLAMIRALSIADLALSVNREEMIRYLDKSSELLARSFVEARELFEKRGGKMTVFPPHVMPSDIKS
jgi:hypothetical protein